MTGMQRLSAAAHALDSRQSKIEETNHIADGV